MTGTVNITVTVADKINSAKVLPSSAGITPEINGNSITFRLASPRHLTVEINGEWLRSLHIFANPPETNVPKSGDPNVVYYGPGIHEVSHLSVSDGQTIYVAGGAIVRCVLDSAEKFTVNRSTGLRQYSPTFDLRGKNITVRGRGIIDASRCTTHARNMISIRNCSDINLEGVILRDASVWTVPIRQSSNVTLKNLKLIGYRANSDGIDICNSTDVLVEDCFIRTLDDLIVIKTDRGRGEARNITARGCVLFNEVAHALSVGAELRENVDNVLFTDCDVIHDKGREWALRIFHSDSALISNVRFENIRIEETRRLISLWINRSVWSLDKDRRGQIKGIVFRDIKAEGEPATVAFEGFDEKHAVEDVLLQNVVVNGKPLTKEMIKMNSYVRNVTIR
jgi:polygalacturonase